MPIERQSEQWPHRREAMLRAAIDHSQPRFVDESRNPSFYHPTEFTTRNQFSPDAFNPPADSKARPIVRWKPAEPEQDTLDLKLPSHFSSDPSFGEHDLDKVLPYWSDDYIYPIDRQPQKLYRSINLDMNHPDMHPVRRALFGNDDYGSSWNPHRHDPTPGLFPASDVTIRRDPRGFDNTDLGPVILDHLNANEHRQGLGTHWTNKPDVARNDFGNKGFSNNIAVMLSAEWMGRGEDPYRTDTGGDYPEEGELTLMPGAPLRITDMHLQHPSSLTWHSIFDTANPQQHTASFDPYEANDYGIEPYHEQDWEDDEDEEPQDGYIRENNPVRAKSPLYPDGHMSRPFFYDDLDDLGGKRKIYHFNPHDFNPPSDSPARGDAYWPRYRKDPPEDVLPLDLPAMAMPNMPTDRYPIPLYRGISFRLDHPDLQWIRRALYGDRREDNEDHQLTPGARWSPHFTDRDKTDGYYFGQPSRQPYLDPSMTNRALADPKEEGDSDLFYDHDLRHRMTHTILDHMNEQKGGLGTHWGMGEANARNFAVNVAPGNHASPSLPVVITHNWMGTGEDPYRRNTEGEWPDEQEITHLHGAKANVSAVHVQHPHHGWVKIFDADDHGETLTHKASR